MLPREGRSRVVIERVSPSVDNGRFPAKRIIGDLVRVEADIFADGHDTLAAVLRSKHESSDWSEQRMRADVNDRWCGDFFVSELGRYFFTIHAWVDHFETWRRDLLKRIQAGADTEVDYQIGADFIEQAAGRASGPDAQWLRERAKALQSDIPIVEIGRAHV